MAYQPYPKCLYHPTKEAVVVADEAAHKAFGPEWVESPVEAKPLEAEPPPAKPKKVK